MRHGLWGIAVAFCVATSGCGGGSSKSTMPTPTAPTPTPPPIAAARISASGQGEWLGCSSISDRCDFQGEARNVGAGCADAVRGTTRFFNGSLQLGTAFSWTLSSTRVIRANEAFTYRTNSVPNTTTTSTTRYETEASWTNVRCP